MMDYVRTWWASFPYIDISLHFILQTLVFVETKRKTDELTRRLRSQG